jgi:hypothetical protein
MESAMECLNGSFPTFYQLLRAGKSEPVEEVLPAATEDDIAAIEDGLGIPLPHSYKQFLRCTRGFNLRGGVIRFGQEMPFFHDFPPFGRLTPRQREAVRRKGGGWPPPSQGMLCVAEYWRDADGDQVLFDVADGLKDGEYPVVYYAHEDNPPSVEPLADSFAQWLEELLTDDETGEDSSVTS